MDRKSPTVLLNDLYQFTMAQTYISEGIAGRRAVFELFFRKPPHGGTFALACGIGPALDFIEEFRFGAGEIEYLRSTGIFSDQLTSRLADLRFSGDVDAVPEGTVVFPREPLLRVSAPILEAQLLETPLLNLIGFATLVATKAARICTVAAPAEVVEFGCRRSQGPDGAITAARAAFVGGCSSTSNLEAGRRFGIPVKGTMAHSLVMAFSSELEAFRAFTQEFPGPSILLIDTEDTLRSGLPRAIDVARELQATGARLAGVRLDSGDLAELSRKVRAELDREGFPEVKIFASGDLDELEIADLVAAGAPIDAYGVGTRLSSSGGDSALTCVYKLVAVEEGGGSRELRARRKRSDDPGKATLPGVKQVHRLFDQNSLALGDVLALDSPGDGPEAWLQRESATEAIHATDTVPLLEPVFREGRRLKSEDTLGDLQVRARASLESIPAVHRRNQKPSPYPLTLSPGLKRLCSELEVS